MVNQLIRAVALAFVALAAIASPAVQAQTQFPKAIGSVEFEALLPRIGLADTAHAAALLEYDHYQKAASDLRTGACERYLKQYGGVGAGDFELDFDAVSEARPLEEVKAQMRAYRALLGQWDTLESTLVDALIPLGASPERCQHVKGVLEARCIEQIAAQPFTFRMGSQSDLWNICSEHVGNLSEAERARVLERIVARDGEYFEAMRAVRSASLATPERLSEARARAMADHPRPDMPAPGADGTVPDTTGWVTAFNARIAAISAASRDARKPLSDAWHRVTRTGASIVQSAFEGTPLPAGAKAWRAFMLASGAGNTAGNDGGAINMVERVVKAGTATPEQLAAVNALFTAWQAQSLEAALTAPAGGVIVNFDGDDGGALTSPEKAMEASRSRTAALADGVRAALGLPAEADEAIVADAPDGGDRAGGDAVPSVSVVGITLVDGDGTEPSEVGGGMVVSTVAGSNGEGGEPFDFSGDASKARLRPVSAQDLSDLFELCGAADAVRAVAQQMHRDYLAEAVALEEAMKAAPSPGVQFSGRQVVTPTLEGIGQYFDTLREVQSSMQRLDEALFDDLRAIIDEKCIALQAQFRERALLRACTNTRGGGLAGAGGAAGAEFVDPERIIRAAQTAGAVDAATATSLRGALGEQFHPALLAALRTQFNSTLAKGRRLAEIEVEFTKISDQPEATGQQVTNGIGEEMFSLMKELVASSKSVAGQSNGAIDSLTQMVPDAQRVRFMRSADALRYPWLFNDLTDMEPMFTKALALSGLDTATQAAVQALESEYRAEYGALREKLTTLRDEAVMPDWSEMGHGGDAGDFQTRYKDAQSAARRLSQLKSDREELNRRTMRQLQAALGEARASEIGDLPTPKARRGMQLPQGLELFGP